VIAQEAFKEPDYSKFPPESGPITLEVWSWVAGLAQLPRFGFFLARLGPFSAVDGPRRLYFTGSVYDVIRKKSFI